MKKLLCVFLSLLLLFSLAGSLPAACAEDFTVWNGNVSATLTSVSFNPDLMYVFVELLNPSPEPYQFEDLFSMDIHQGGQAVCLSPGDPLMLMNSTRKSYDSISSTFIYAYVPRDSNAVMEITIKSADSSVQPLTVWYNPFNDRTGSRDYVMEKDSDDSSSGSSGTESQDPGPVSGSSDSTSSGSPVWTCPACGNVVMGKTCPICGEPRPEEGAQPEQTRRGGSLPDPEPEDDFLPIQFYRFVLSDGEGNDVTGNDYTFPMYSAGRYTCTFESETELHGLSYAELRILNTAKTATETKNMDHHSIRVEQILVDGRPVLFGKNANFFRELRNDDGSQKSIWIASPLYCLNVDPEKYGIYSWYWDGDYYSPGAMTLVDPAEFSAYHSVSVTFTYGRFTPPEDEPEEDPATALRPGPLYPMLCFALQGEDAAGNPIGEGAQQMISCIAGRFTLTLESDTEVSGLGRLSLSARNSSLNPANTYNLQDRAFRIEEILVDGQPVSFGKVTNYAMTDLADDGSMLACWLSAPLYDPSADPENYGEFYWTWDKDGSPASAVVVDPAEFASFRTVSVTFSYGQYGPAEAE